MWHCQWSPCSQRSFASTTPANLKPLLRIQSPQLFVVDQDAFAAEHEQKTAIAKTPPNRRQLTQLGSDGSVIRPHTEVSHRGPIRPDHFTRPPLTDLKTRTKVSHRLPPCDGRHHFFELRSFNMALSSIASASSFFSLAFSSVKTFNRRASDTSSPPYLAFHL